MQIVLSKFNRSLLLWILGVLIFLIPAAADAKKPVKNKTLVVIGTSEVKGENIQAARDQAISESLVSAVALMTEEILEVDSLVENFGQVNEIVYDKSKTFVQNYKVLTEARSGKSYRVIVQATVSGRKIAKQLSKAGILRTKTTLPAVLFLIAEQGIQDTASRYWWKRGMANFNSVAERSMREIFTQQGYPVIGHRKVQIQKVVDWGTDDKSELTDEEAANLGARLQAAVVVVGTSTADAASNVMGSELRSFKGTLIARAIRTDTAEQIATIARTAVAANVNENMGGKEALADAGTLAGEALALQLAEEWQRLAEKPSQVEVLVEGTGNLSNFIKFRRALSGISGVEGIRVKEIKPNETTLIVEYQGKAEDLASALMLQNFENFGINIYEILPQNLKIMLISG
jgi:hypothetical protein